MTIKKLKPVQYKISENFKHFDIYRSDEKTQGNKKAVIFAQISISPDKAIAKSLLAYDHPRIAYLAPDGYALYAVRGHLSNYNTTEYFDLYQPGEYYPNFQILPPESDIFAVDDEKNCMLMCTMTDFDVVIIKHPVHIFDLLNTEAVTGLYSDMFFHCSRLTSRQHFMKYFMPVEQHAHILAHHKSLDWVKF